MTGLAVFLCVCITAAFCSTDYEAEVNKRQDVNRSRVKAFRWLLSQRNKDWGWGTRDFPETHRALTALCLSGELKNQTETLEYQLSVKQLEVEVSLALSRIKKISAGQLALYANALLATCRDPNDFYGHNIIEKMRPQQKLSTYAEALVSLAVSNSGHLLTKKEIVRYFELLDNYTKTAFPDTRAMIVLALSSTGTYKRHHFIQLYIQQHLKSLRKLQKSDGRFGNIYSSALVVQALIGAKDKGKRWDFHKAMDYILSQQEEDGSFGDPLATYFVLPVLAGRSLVDLRRVNCKPTNETLEDDLLEDGFLNGTIAVRYSVWGKTYFSDIFTVPEGSPFYDVMVEAQRLDDRYRFSGSSSSWGYFVQEIGGIRNDPTCNKYWMLYKQDINSREMTLSEKGVSTEIPQNGDHYMFRYEKSSFAPVDDVTCDHGEESDVNSTISTTDVDKNEDFESTTSVP